MYLLLFIASLMVSVFCSSVAYGLSSLGLLSKKNARYTVGYVYNVGYNDSFELRYSDYQKGSRDFYLSVGQSLGERSRYYHELELRSSRAVPMLRQQSGRDASVVDVVRKINANDRLTATEVANMLSAKRVAVLYSMYYGFPVTGKVSMYVGSGFGAVKVIEYRGFRKYSENIYGLALQARMGLTYRVNDNLQVYMGYSNYKNYWKYKTDTIYDEDGNSVLYDFVNFELGSHGVDFGVKLTG